MLFHDGLKSFLDKLICLEVHMFHSSWPAFQACGYAGLMCAVILVMILAMHLGLSLWVVSVITLAAVLTFFALVMLTKVLTGEERITYYHHEIAVIAVSALVMRLLRQPILPYLDLTILGVGLFLACGRMGCLMVGCCHGLPHHWGVCYGEEHAKAGLTPYFIGVRLFPIQVIESVWVLGIVIAGSAFILDGHPPGTAVAWYVVTYDLGRFCFEFLRGDPNRPYLWGFSEAQWISVALMSAVVGGELLGVFPLALWHAGALVWLILTMIAVALKRHLRRGVYYRLFQPRHIIEVAEAVERAFNETTERPARSTSHALPHVRIARTSLGIQISGSKSQSVRGCFHHYTLSSRNEIMGGEIAQKLADLICQLKHPCDAVKLIEGKPGIFHLLLQSLLEDATLSPGCERAGEKPRSALVWAASSSNGHLMGAGD
jgi:prolipoprotein diacylglyceryltransferase